MRRHVLAADLATALATTRRTTRAICHTTAVCVGLPLPSLLCLFVQTLYLSEQTSPLWQFAPLNCCGPDGPSPLLFPRSFEGTPRLMSISCGWVRPACNRFPENHGYLRCEGGFAVPGREQTTHWASEACIFLSTTHVEVPCSGHRMRTGAAPQPGAHAAFLNTALGAPEAQRGSPAAHVSGCPPLPARCAVFFYSRFVARERVSLICR